MKFVLSAILASLLLPSLACVAADQDRGTYFLQLPLNDVKSLGQIDKLVVTVACGRISTLRNIPELYNIHMGYDIPGQNVMDAQPRLGGAAVDLSGWSGVIGIQLPYDADNKSCFKVTVTAEGRSGQTREWNGAQLGLPK